MAMNDSSDALGDATVACAPQAELNFYCKDNAVRKIGSGFSDIGGRMRLRY
jgi:hypothetical protein